MFFCVCVVLSLLPPPTYCYEKEKRKERESVCVCERERKKIPKESKFLFVPKNLDSRSHRNVSPQIFNRSVCRVYH